MLKLTTLPPLLLAFALTSCATPRQSTPTPPVTGGISPVAPSVVYVPADYSWICALTPIQLSHKDTDATKAQVIPLNAATDRVCKR